MTTPIGHHPLGKKENVEESNLYFKIDQTSPTGSKKPTTQTRSKGTHEATPREAQRRAQKLISNRTHRRERKPYRREKLPANPSFIKNNKRWNHAPQ